MTFDLRDDATSLQLVGFVATDAAGRFSILVPERFPRPLRIAAWGPRGGDGRRATAEVESPSADVRLVLPAR